MGSSPTSGTTFERETAETWPEVHGNAPESRYVGGPGGEECYRQWSMYTFGLIE